MMEITNEEVEREAESLHQCNANSLKGHARCRLENEKLREQLDEAVSGLKQIKKGEYSIESYGVLTPEEIAQQALQKLERSEQQ